MERFENQGDDFIYQGRIAICSPRDIGDGFKQHGISAVLIAPEGQPLLCDSGDWENIQCEIIIRPLKKLGKLKIKNARMDHAALQLGNDKAWENG